MNRVRGETEMMIGDQCLTFCLTLGALAEIETLLGCRNLQELQIRLRCLSAAEIVSILDSLARAGGTPDAIIERAPFKTLSPSAASQAIAEAFHVALA